ncbi:MAG: DUF4058 family protein, partial [Elainellaceae cyanobacterium]
GPRERQVLDPHAAVERRDASVRHVVERHLAGRLVDGVVVLPAALPGSAQLEREPPESSVEGMSPAPFAAHHDHLALVLAEVRILTERRARVRVEASPDHVGDVVVVGRQSERIALAHDVHSDLASKIRQQLAPRLRPKYIARLEVYLAEDPFPEGEIGILYPDVEVLKAREQPTPKPASEPGDTASANTLTITPPGLTVPVPKALQVRLISVEIRDTARNQLITSIEILSPVNKREPGLTKYRQKQVRLYQAKVHLIEIDLLRRGRRPFAYSPQANTAYCVALTRAPAEQMDLWPISLSSPLPVIPVPLQAPDKDVPLDLQAALASIYDEAAYDLSVDYSQPPPPPALSPAEADVLQSALA